MAPLRHPLRRWRERGAAPALLLLPFVLFAWQLPFVGGHTIGNDYTIFPTRWQQELFFSLRFGTYPLFVPGFAGGHGSSVLSLGELHHPLSWLCVLSPGYWHGLALDWNTFYRLLSLGLTHLVLFRLFRRLGTGSWVAALLGGIAVYNLRTLDWFRFGASLESYTAFLVGSASLVWTWLEPARVLPRAGLVLAVAGAVLGGHPQVMYYALLGMGLVALVTPAWVAAVTHEPVPGWRPQARFLLCALALAAGGVALTAVHVLPYLGDFLADNAERVGRDYAWADDFRDSLAGTFDNFFRPLWSCVGGSFGGSALFLLAALVPLVALARVRLPVVIVVLWGLCLFCFLHMQGGRTPVHRFVWSTLPLANCFRVAGRVSMLLPLFFALLLAWAARLERRGGRHPLFGVALLALFLTLVHPLLPEGWSRVAVNWSPVTFREIPGAVHDAVSAAGVLVLVGVVLATRSPRRLALAGALVVAASALQLGLSLGWGTWIEEKRPSPSFAELCAERRALWGFRGDHGHGLFPSRVLELIENNATVEPFLAKLYPEAVPIASSAEFYAVTLGGRRDPGVAWIEGELSPAGVARAAGPGSTPSVRLVRATFNEVELDVESPRSAVLGLGVPFSGRWSATVDGAAAVVRPANGVSQAVAVPAGSSRVAWRYESPAAVRGAAISCAALSVLAALLARATLASRVRRALVPLALALGPLVFLAWRASLYGGEHLGTRYAWTWSGPGPLGPNLAYGCRAGTSNIRGPQWKHELDGGAAVDGMRQEGLGTLSRTEERPHWTLSLGRPTLVGTVLVHEGHEALGRRSKREPEDPVNERPLLLLASNDYERWRIVARVTEPPDPARPDEPLRLELDPPVPALFLRITGEDTRLALREVEVFGPR